MGFLEHGNDTSGSEKYEEFNFAVQLHERDDTGSILNPWNVSCFSGITFGNQKRNFDEIDRTGFNGFAKKNFDEIDRSGFDSFVKKNFDEIDRVGFGSFVKRNAPLMLYRDDEKEDR
jgi:hypothetical protein